MIFFPLSLTLFKSHIIIWYSYSLSFLKVSVWDSVWVLRQTAFWGNIYEKLLMQLRQSESTVVVDRGKFSPQTQ